MKRALFVALTFVIIGGCMTSTHKPLAFKREADVDCPDWAVEVEVDGRFYCVDRAAFEDPEH